MEITNQEIATLINAKLHAQEIFFAPKLAGGDITTDGKWKNLIEHRTIDVSGLKCVKSMFKDMEMSVKYGVYEHPKGITIYIEVRYTYEHHCGSNGYTCNFRHENNSWKQVD